MRGAKPKPTVLKIRNGNPGNRPLNNHEPKPNTEMPGPPDHLNDLARQEWDRMAKELHSIGILTSIDGAGFALYCQAYARWVESEGHVLKEGMVIETHTGALKQNPYLSIANHAMKQMKEFLAEFGMTPSSRSRLKVDPPKDLDDSKDKFFNRG